MKTVIRVGMCLGMMFPAVGSASPLRAEEPGQAPLRPAKVEIGVPASLFQGVPEFLLAPLSAPFRQMMKDQTGIDGNVQHLGDAMTVADRLHSGKLQLAIFQGHEFGWAKAKYKDLQPLVVILPNQPPTQAFLVVRWDSAAKDLGDLKDRILTLSRGTKDPTKLFLEQQKKALLGRGTLKATFTADSIRDAFFDVIEDKAQVTCVDAVALEYFRLTFPGQYKNLKIIAESEIFPQACIAVRKGQMDEATNKKFQDALLKAADLNEGKRMMTLWKLQRFEAVPANYEQHLKDCNKVYPFQGVPSATPQK